MNWPSWRKFLAWEDLDGVAAWKMLKDPQAVSSLTPDALYDVVLAATRSTPKAEAAALRRAEVLARRDEGR